MFIRELRDIKQTTNDQWLILGDFNLIYKEQDKNQGTLNRRLMLRFRRVLNSMEVRVVHLNGRKFTWSNGQSSPTMTRIDRVFCIPEWERVVQAAYPTTPLVIYLRPLPSPPDIDDYSLGQPEIRFEAFWTSMPGFLETVQDSWSREVPDNVNQLAALHIKLSRTAKALRGWAKSLVSQGKIVMAVCRRFYSSWKKLKRAGS
jgi:hypothetical protein